ncbi:MAG: DUF2156 domain-containing protein [Chloroflexi bacterium]|nr:DUF2156 domain-containing protein [Chloroflexota bacterium]
MRRHNPTERRFIAVSALLLGCFNVFVTAFPAPLSGFGQIEDVFDGLILNGSRFALITAGGLLLTTVPGLLHGKRLAWMLALGCCAASAALHPLKNVDLWGTFASVLLAGVLLGARQQFPARSDRPTVGRGALVLIGAMCMVFVYSVVGLYLLDREFHQPTPLSTALSDTLRLLLVFPATTVEPRTAHGAWFLDSVRFLVVATAMFGGWQVLRSVFTQRVVSRAERERVRALLEQYGESSLAHFALLPGKDYFFSDSGQAVLAYCVEGSTAVVMGDPIGDESDIGALLAAFDEHCELNGWTYALHQATPRYLDLYARAGLKALTIGEEAIVEVQSFLLTGRPFKHIRATMNRFEREAYRAEVLAPPHPPELMSRLRQLSDAWLAQGNRRERTFTLGYFDSGLLQGHAIMVARAADGSIVGFADIVPSYRSREGNFDMLRYAEEPKAIADFLYVSLIEYFRRQGFEGMILGLAPFSGAGITSQSSPAGRAMSLLYKRGGFLFRYRGLREFKEKFQPRWEPRYLVYRGEMQLPGIALAVARAGELRHGFVRRPAPEDVAARSADALAAAS